MTDTVKYSKPLDVRSIPVKDLKPAKYNPRTIDDKAFEGLVNAIRDFGQRENLIVNKDMTVISGHMRLRALKQLGHKEVMCDVVELSKADEKKLNLLMNSQLISGEFDMLKVDELLNELKLMGEGDLGLYRLPELGTLDLSDGGNDEDEKVKVALEKLADRFIIPPFSVIDTRQEAWQDRKRTWVDLGIKSEVGRDGDLMLKSTGFLADEINKRGGGTSIFDPALCEVLYTWFGVPGGKVLDPFAGGSVRGVVAHKLGMGYSGVELRGEQVAANRKNCEQIFGKGGSQLKPALQWVEGDSQVMLDDFGQDFDFVFSCPPYADLEVYSDDPADLSNMPYSRFLQLYGSIIEKAVSKLKPNRFACFVVSEVRAKDGTYYNFVADTIAAFASAGCQYYNEIVLINPAGTLPIRVGRQFNAGRKVGRSHQNILVFYKGNVKEMKNHFKPIDVRPASETDKDVIKL